MAQGLYSKFIKWLFPFANDFDSKIDSLRNEFVLVQKMRGATERGMLYCLAYRIKVLTEKTQYNINNEKELVLIALKKDFATLTEDELKSVIKTIYNES